MTAIRVLLADDHTIVRQGLRRLLETQPDFTVIAEADNGRAAVQLAIRHRPNVVVLDMAMPSLNGIEATRQLTREVPEARVLALSAYSDEEYVLAVCQAGAAGYLVKHSAATELISAIREAMKGNAYFSPGIAKYFTRHAATGLRSTRSGLARGKDLTPREREVLQLIAEGRGNKQIAAALAISVKTVEKHRQSVMDKLDIHDIAGLTRYALGRKIIENEHDSVSP
jgi:DNA-binding NarL/FixJ family response regulator